MKWTIKRRLVIGFILFSIITISIFIRGQISLNSLNRQFTTIIDREVERIIFSQRCSSLIQLITKREKDFLLETSVAGKERYLDVIRAKTEEMLSNVDSLRAISDDRGIELLDTFTKEWASYERLLDVIVDIGMDTSDEAQDEATNVSTTQARAAAFRAIDVFDKLVQKNTRALDEAQKAVDDQSGSTKNTLMVLLGFYALVILGSVMTVRAINSSLKKAKDVVNNFASGNLAIQRADTGNDEMGEVLSLIYDCMERQKEILTEVITFVKQITHAGSQLKESSDNLSDGSQQQASDVEEILASMEEMAANIKQNSDNASETQGIALKSTQDMLKAKEVVDTTINNVRTIAEKISIIGQFASQTNLLALNAAVEAARAGEHGKGFNVVAGEVRKLAEGSQNATQEINDLSENSVTEADVTLQAIDKLMPNIEKTAELVSAIANASEEQSIGVDQINEAIQRFNNIIQHNAAAAEEVNASSFELTEQAQLLKRKISYFKV